MAAISKNMSIQEVVSLIPQSREVFFRRGLGCYGCHYGNFDSVEGCATFHGVDLDELMDEIDALQTPNADAG